VRRAVLTVLLALAASGCATVRDYLGGTDNAEPPAELVTFTPTLPVQIKWSRRVGSGTDKYYLKLVPAVHAGKVFAASHKGTVGAYDAASGQIKWEVDIKVPITGGPGVGAGLVLVGTSDAEVIALGEQDGAVRWRTRVSSEVLAVPQAADGVVVVRTVDGKLLGLNPADGKRIWIYDRGVPILTLRGTSSPVIAEGLVVSGYASGTLVALSLKDGRPVWDTGISVPRGRSELERMVDIDADPVVVDGMVYVVTFQGHIAAVELKSGRIGWIRELSSNAGIRADARNVYVTDDIGSVWSFTRNRGEGLWKQEKLRARSVTAPAVYGDYIVVGDFEGYLHWLARDDGHFVARVRVDDAGILVAPIVVGDTLYVTGKGGVLAALRAGG